MRILVTGGHGFIGSHLLQALKKCDVTDYSLDSGDDILDEKTLNEHMRDVDVVFHLAAVSRIGEEPLKTFELHMPSRVLFGLGIVEKIGAEAKMMKAQNVLIVTDLGVLKAGVASKVQESLLSEGIKTEVWDQVETEPSLSCIEKLLVHIAQGGFVLLIGVGGGSCMDAA
jgi:hypothetical protein